MTINTEQLRKMERLAERCNEFVVELEADPHVKKHDLEQGKKDFQTAFQWICRSITEHEFIDG